MTLAVKLVMYMTDCKLLSLLLTFGTYFIPGVVSQTDDGAVKGGQVSHSAVTAERLQESPAGTGQVWCGGGFCRRP